MRKKFIDRLCCPMCKGELLLNDGEGEEDEIRSGILRCEPCALDYPIKDGIPILVPLALRMEGGDKS